MEDVIHIIGKYYIQPKYTKFNKIIIEQKINWKYLSANTNAIHLLEKNIDKINWRYLSRNKNAIHLYSNLPNLFFLDFFLILELHSHLHTRRFKIAQK